MEGSSAPQAFAPESNATSGHGGVSDAEGKVS